MPTFVAGLFGWMIGYRLLIKLRNTRDEPPTWMLLALSIAIAVLTFICRGDRHRHRVQRLAVPRAGESRSTLTISTSIRPGWLVLGAGLIVTAVDAVRARMAVRRPAAAARPR